MKLHVEGPRSKKFILSAIRYTGFVYSLPAIYAIRLNNSTFYYQRVASLFYFIIDKRVSGDFRCEKHQLVSNITVFRKWFL